MRISPILRQANAQGTGKSQFRILALPLARLPRASTSTNPTPDASQNDKAPSTTTTTSTSAPLMLFHVSQPAPTAAIADAEGKVSDDAKAARKAADRSLPIHQRALNKASEAWLKLGDKPKDSWMYWFYNKGEGLMDKIEYEEWSLKAVQEGVGMKVDKDGKIADADRFEIPLLRPTLSDRPLPPLLPKLHRHLIHRIPYHKKMMIRSLVFSPATWPFAIIPIMPNFPMFYVLWRAWSHYKAWRGALYLEQLLKAGVIVERPSKQLDEVYQSKGVVLGEKGAEDKAPDATRSEPVAGTSTTPAASPSTGTGSGERFEDKSNLPKQAKGETGAVDGTATPRDMIYHGQSTTSSTSTASTCPPRLHHPGLLLSSTQVPLIVRAFDLRQTERMDVMRAVEQAELRLRKADEGKGAAQGNEAGAVDKEAAALKEGAWKGNLHR